MNFMGVILLTNLGSKKDHDICWRIMQRLDPWEVGQYTTLCKYSMAGILYRIAQDVCVSDEYDARAFNLRVLNVKLQAAVRCVCGQ